MPGRILFIDDDPAGREVALFNLRKAGYETIPAADGREGLSLFSASPFDLVITDLKMPGISGMEVLRKVRAGSPDVPVLVITAFGNVETAVAAMKEGAYDFIGKPFHRDQLLLAVSKALERRRLATEVRNLRIRAAGVGRDVVSVSQAMRRLLEVADRVAAPPAPVLLTGDAGTGAEARPFCPGGGAKPPPALQGKLLRALQEKAVDAVGADAPVPVDVRILAATKRDLLARPPAGAFREGLCSR